MPGYRYCLCSLILLISLPAAASELNLEVITLHYRSADEIIPVIKPFVGTDGTVTGMNNQLIIKSTAANIADIKQLLLNIDRKPRRLMITVSHDISETVKEGEQAFAGRYSSGNSAISAGSHQDHGSGSGLSLHDQDADIRFRLDSERTTQTSNSDYRVQTLEGQPAFIETGSRVPVTDRTAYMTPQGVTVQDSTEYYNATSGFYVEPNINGDIVTLSISPFITMKNPEHRGEFKMQNIETTVQGRLGEWIEIGGIDQESRHESSGLLYQQHQTKEQEHKTYLKVEEIP